MDFLHDGFDVWVFRRNQAGVEYLLLKSSKKKADKWFAGGQFWQIPSHFVGDATVVDAVTQELARFSMAPTGIWAAEHAYTFYNRRYDAIVHIAVFAAEVSAAEVAIDDAFEEYRWVSAADAERLVTFRGLREGLNWVRHYVTEAETLLPELRLA